MVKTQIVCLLHKEQRKIGITIADVQTQVANAWCIYTLCIPATCLVYLYTMHTCDLLGVFIHHAYLRLAWCIYTPCIPATCLVYLHTMHTCDLLGVFIHHAYLRLAWCIYTPCIPATCLVYLYTMHTYDCGIFSIALVLIQQPAFLTKERCGGKLPSCWKPNTISSHHFEGEEGS